MAKLYTYKISLYTFEPLKNDVRDCFSVPGNPYRDEPQSESHDYLKEITAFAYRDQFSPSYLILPVPEYSENPRDLQNFAAFWHSVTLETDNATFSRPAKWPGGRRDPQFNDPWAWNIFNMPVTIEAILEIGIKHASIPSKSRKSPDKSPGEIAP